MRFLTAVILSLLVALSSIVAAQDQGSITQAEIIRLLEFKVPQEQIIEKVKESGTVFVLGEEDIERLKKAGANEALLEAMGASRSALSSGIEISQAETAEISDLALVVDYSGSMNAKTPDGVSKIEAAKSALETLIGKLPSDLNVALVVYGMDKSRGCEDIDIVQPLGPLDKSALQQKVKSFSAKGMTPIADSLRKAGTALESAKGGRAIILVTDGVESCKGDPTEVARSMAQQFGTKFGLHVIGFDLKPEEKKALEELAGAGRGKYLDAENATQLAEAMQKVTETVAVAPKDREARTYEAAGEEVKAGEWFNTAPQIGPGEYKGNLRMKEARFYRLPVQEGQEVRIVGQFKKTPLPGSAFYKQSLAQDFIITIYDADLNPVAREEIKVPENPTTPVTCRVVWTAESSGSAYLSVAASQNYSTGSGWKELVKGKEEDLEPSQYTLRIRGGEGGDASLVPVNVKADAGSSFENAGEIGQSGLATDDIKFDENAFFAVPVKDGDVLNVTAAVQKPWEAREHYFNPIKATYKLTIYDDDQVEVASKTLDVEHNPPDAYSMNLSWPVTLGGKAYIVLSLQNTGQNHDRNTQTPTPGRFSLLVTGIGQNADSAEEAGEAEEASEEKSTTTTEEGAPKDPFSGAEAQ